MEKTKYVVLSIGEDYNYLEEEILLCSSKDEALAEIKQLENLSIDMFLMSNKMKQTYDYRETNDTTDYHYIELNELIKKTTEKKEFIIEEMEWEIEDYNEFLELLNNKKQKSLIISRKLINIITHELDIEIY